MTEGVRGRPRSSCSLCAIYPLEHESIYFEVPNGETAGMAGVGEDGLIWMLCTPAIHKYPLTFAREAKVC